MIVRAADNSRSIQSKEMPGRSRVFTVSEEPRVVVDSC